MELIKGFNVEYKGKCQGPDSSSFLYLSALTFTTEFLIISPQQIIDLTFILLHRASPGPYPATLPGPCNSLKIYHPIQLF